MGIRTDLAAETLKIEETEGYFCETDGDFILHFNEISGQEKCNKPKGKYLTLEFKSVDMITDFEPFERLFLKGMRMLFEKSENVLVVGLGNREITADSIGPKTAEKILATRHIMGEFAENIGLHNLKSVAVLVPNVLGKTGIEVQEILTAICDKTQVDTVIVIDALCAKSEKRLFKNIQITDSGIAPGSGVKNSRREISQKTLNKRVIAIGVPTVIEYKDSRDGLIVTPKDCDLLTDKISEILSRNLNLLLQSEIDREILFQLV